jgi:hypothetical protein
MEDGDHGQCRIELRACPEHEAEQQRDIAEAMSSGPDPAAIQQWRERLHCECGCTETEMGKIVGWCLWCDHVYQEYDRDIEARHFAYHCPEAPKELRQSARERLANLGQREK